MTGRRTLIASLTVALGLLAFVSIWPTLHEPTTWTPDGLYYQERLLEIRGVDDPVARERVFEGPLSAELRGRDPHRAGNATWVDYNEPFYERRVALPLAGAALYPVAGDRSLLYLSVAGYVATILALFGFLLLRFRVAIASLVTLGAVFLPPLVNHSSFPLTDSWGLALLIVTLTAAILALDRGLGWVPLWIVAILILGFTRDSTWIPVLAAGWCAFRYRSRVPVTLFATGLAAALPPLLLYQVPVRELLAELVNGLAPSGDTSWSFVLSHYPAAVLELVRANVGFVRGGEWYTALYLVGGVLSLLWLVWRRPATRNPTSSLLAAGSIAGLLYVLAAPAFSAFRLELVFLPMAAWGLALMSELVRARVAERQGTLARLPAASRRS